jgi:hypothetical protein
MLPTVGWAPRQQRGRLLVCRSLDVEALLRLWTHTTMSMVGWVTRDLEDGIPAPGGTLKSTVTDPGFTPLHIQAHLCTWLALG